jgi:Tfp pilus assembly protein PilX
MTGLRNFSDGWKRGNARAVASPRASEEIDNRGVALVITLLLLFLMSVLGLAAVLSTSSDLMINGYYGNTRASFYAADAGLNIARQAMETEVNGLVPTTWNSASWNQCGTGTSAGPLATGSAGTTGSSANSMLGAITKYANTTYLSGSKATTPGAAANSWPESFTITNTGATNPYPIRLDPNTNNPTVTCIDGFPTQYTYQYDYTLTSVGTAGPLGSASITENGSIFVNVIAPAGVVPENISFSSFGAYIGSSPPCQSSSYVSGTISGPTFVDATVGCSVGVTHCGSWNFGTSGSYIFTDPVNQTGPQFSYNISGCNLSTAASYTKNGTTIAPNFESGYNLAQAPIQIPQNDFSQRWAVLDGHGCGVSEGGGTCTAIPPVLPPAPTAQQMNAYNLQNANQNNTAAQPYATVSGSTYTPATAGVFLPYTCSGSTCTLSPTAGGIWVEGSGSGVTTTVQLSTTNGAGGATNPSGQVIAVTQSLSSTSSTGSPSMKAGSCTTSHGTTTCTFQQVTTTSTPSTVTTITVDPVADQTAVATNTQSTVSSTTTKTTTNSCYTNGCTPSTPTSGYSGGSPVNCTSNCTSTTATDNLTLAGVPQNLNSQAPTFPGTSMPAATMIYVDGSVSVSGPSSGAAIQNNSMVTLTANGNITQTGNITYATEPVTTSASGNTPADSLIAANENMNQVLGLYTDVGQFQLKAPSSGANMETDGTVAMISTNLTGCSNGVDCSNGDIATVGGNSVGTWTLIGGKAESAVNGVNMSKSNIYYDQRFKVRNNFAPPWFPQTTILAQDVVTSSKAPFVSISPQRTQWVNQTGGQ